MLRPLSMKVVEKIYIPAKKYPEHNFVGALLLFLCLVLLGHGEDGIQPNSPTYTHLPVSLSPPAWAQA